VAVLALVVGTATTALADSTQGDISAGCQGYAGGPDGPPLGPVTNLTGMTATITHPDSAVAGAAFDVSVDFAGWQNGPIPVQAEDNKVQVHLNLTGATETSVIAVGGPPGVSAMPNQMFDVPTSSASITPTGGEPVTVTLNGFQTDNFGANVFVDCELTSGAVVAEIPVDDEQDMEEPTGSDDSGDGMSDDDGQDMEEATGSDDSDDQLPVTGSNTAVFVVIGIVLLAFGLMVLGLRRQLEMRAHAAAKNGRA
jgi:LPXTG-motif cell wall-anchored protein